MATRRQPVRTQRTRLLYGVVIALVAVAGVVGAVLYRTGGAGADERQPLPSLTTLRNDVEQLESYCTQLDVPCPPLGAIEWETAQAVRDALDTAWQRPDEAEAWGTLGMVYHAHGMRNFAEPAYHRAGELDPENLAWVYLSAYVDFEEGRWQEAVKGFERAKSIDVSYAPTFLQLGHCFLELRQLDDAAGAYARYASLQPNDPLGFFGLGEVAREKGDDREAVAQFEHALRVDPENYRVLYGLSSAFRRLGQTEKADAYAQRSRTVEKRIYLNDEWVRRKDEHSTTIPAQEKRMKAAMTEGRLPEAVGLAEKIVERAPTHTEAWVSLAQGYRQQQRFTEAEQAARRALELEPDLPVAMQVLGGIYLDQQLFEQARHVVDRTVSTSPDFDPAWAMRASVYQQLQDLEEALRSIRKAVELRPNRMLYHRDLAVLLAASGQPAPALEALDRYLETAPDDQPARQFRQGLVQMLSNGSDQR